MPRAGRVIDRPPVRFRVDAVLGQAQSNTISHFTPRLTLL